MTLGKVHDTCWQRAHRPPLLRLPTYPAPQGEAAEQNQVSGIGRGEGQRTGHKHVAERRRLRSLLRGDWATGLAAEKPGMASDAGALQHSGDGSGTYWPS